MEDTPRSQSGKPWPPVRVYLLKTLLLAWERRELGHQAGIFVIRRHSKGLIQAFYRFNLQRKALVL